MFLYLKSITYKGILINHTYFAFEKSVVQPLCRTDPPLPVRGTADPDVGPDPTPGPDNRSGSQARPDIIEYPYEILIVTISYFLFKLLR